MADQGTRLETEDDVRRVLDQYRTRANSNGDRKHAGGDGGEPFASGPR